MYNTKIITILMSVTLVFFTYNCSVSDIIEKSDLMPFEKHFSLLELNLTSQINSNKNRRNLNNYEYQIDDREVLGVGFLYKNNNSIGVDISINNYQKNKKYLIHKEDRPYSSILFGLEKNSSLFNNWKETYKIGYNKTNKQKSVCFEMGVVEKQINKGGGI